jgi:hypothetical protein
MDRSNMEDCSEAEVDTTSKDDMEQGPDKVGQQWTSLEGMETSTDHKDVFQKGMDATTWTSIFFDAQRQNIFHQDGPGFDMGEFYPHPEEMPRFGRW